MPILQKNFNPIVEPEQFIKLEDPKSGKYAFFQVIFMEELPTIITTIDLPANGSVSQEVKELETGAGELVQVRMRGFGFAEVLVNQPQAVGRFTTKNYQARIMLPKYNYDNRSEIFVFQSLYPKLIINDLSGEDQVFDIEFSGFRFVLNPISGVPSKYTTVYLSGFSPRSQITTF